MVRTKASVLRAREIEADAAHDAARVKESGCSMCGSEGEHDARCFHHPIYLSLHANLCAMWASGTLDPDVLHSLSNPCP